MSFNPRQPRDGDGKWSSSGGAGGSYVGRRRAASQVERASRRFAPQQAKSRTAAERAASSKSVRVGMTRAIPVGTAESSRLIGAAKEYRDKLASGEIKVRPASPKNVRLYGREFPPEVAVRERGDPEVAAARYALSFDRGLRQQRSSTPSVARKQKAWKAFATAPDRRSVSQRAGRRGPAFPLLTKAKTSR